MAGALQKRALTKDSFPGRYDTSSAGHIQAGDEPLKSAMRELKEELGIAAKPEQLQFVDTFRYNMRRNSIIKYLRIMRLLLFMSIWEKWILIR